MALTDLATTGAREQLVVRLEAAGLAWNEGGSRCQVEAGGLVDHHKEEQEGCELHVSWLAPSLSIRGDPHFVRMFQSQSVDHHHCCSSLRLTDFISCLHFAVFLFLQRPSPVCCFVPRGLVCYHNCQLHIPDVACFEEKQTGWISHLA